MENQQTPQVLAQPFCSQGDKNTIPNAATGTNKASLQEGFPPITGQPINQGGIPPERQDFNGAMNLNSQFYFAFQNGWWPTFTQEVSDAIGGYPQNAILCYFVPASNSVQFVRSLIPNNTYNFVTTPSYIGQYWVKCLMESAGLPMGAVYYSQSALASDNPGAVPAWQGVFEQNGSQTYPEFFSWITSHTELCITKTEYDSDITTYGECPFYVLNETSAGNLRFPQLVNYIKNANSTDGITQSAAGLPNITGSLTNHKQDFDNATGAFQLTGAASNNLYSANGSSRTGNYGVASLDASLSSSVYGSSDTVTPAHTTLYPWIVVNPSATSISQCVLLSQVGTANGVASLDDNACVPFAQMPAEVVDNIDIPFDPSAYGWPDIRPAARPNAIVLMAGVKADYSAYDNLGFVATCEGGYNVFIDGEQYGQTYASGAQCSVTWSQYSATAGFSVLQPEALTAHVVQIVPATDENNLTAFKCARVASSGTEQQGVLWAHVNFEHAVDVSFYTFGAVNTPMLTAVTVPGNTLKINSSIYFSFANCTALAYVPVLDGENRTINGGQTFNTSSSLKKVHLKNMKFSNLAYIFYGASALEKVIFENVDTSACTMMSGVIAKVKNLPYIDFTSAIDCNGLFSGGKGEMNPFMLDTSYANNVTRFSVSGISELVGLLVSKFAPFTDSSPQINVSNTGLDQNALAALFNSLPTVTAGQIINITGATGASALTAQQLAIATNKGWTVTR